VCDLETSRMGAPYIYDISHLRVNVFVYIFSVFPTEIFYCVNSYVLDEGVCVRRASREKSF